MALAIKREAAPALSTASNTDFVLNLQAVHYPESLVGFAANTKAQVKRLRQVRIDVLAALLAGAMPI
ncbi:MAG: hypothetical protein CFE44_10515 [Burkholderiales bacterium PBB4]|nr:MAG: hypothetical protein CFE44_10515 [Burkholderiales bacterium PBB4]